MKTQEWLDNITNVYLLGIGGIGMSALARYFNANGFRVAGYDKTPSALTERLSSEGVQINHIDQTDYIPRRYRDPYTTLVIYTPAMPQNSEQMAFFHAEGFQLYKRSEVLGIISLTSKALCIAGTHGKTTISTMLAYLLKNSSVGCNAFLGGISVNYGTNLLLDSYASYTVIEADEFDRSFLHLWPDMALITAMDADHLDIYGDEAAMRDAFQQFAALVSSKGKLFVKKGLHITGRAITGNYAVNDSTATCYADNLRLENGRYTFDYHSPRHTIRNLRLGSPGAINVENATAAITLALEAGVTPREISASLPDFQGVLRRFQICTEGPRVTYIDDYAHHPREIEAVLRSIREMWPEQRLTVAFQPHLYSRTRDFHEAFADALNLANEVILIDIYPAREKLIPGVTSALIQKYLTTNSVLLSREDFPEYVRTHVSQGLFVTLGAGDIDRFAPYFTDLFTYQP